MGVVIAMVEQCFPPARVIVRFGRFVDTLNSTLGVPVCTELHCGGVIVVV
jgi:hypothetical protein